MNFNQRLPVFITEEHPCSYLDDRKARTAFVDPSVPISKSLASALNLQGFRRSGRYLYKTSCENCSACQPLRVDIGQFKPNKSQKRNWKKNADVQADIKNACEIDDLTNQRYYLLYEQYICARHDKGDMFPPDLEQFNSFIGQLYLFSKIIEFSIEGNLAMVALCDELEDGLSAIYTFFDPDLSHRGLGVYSALWQIQYCLEQDLPYLYMGFWIEECSKMNYKSCYKPHQIFRSGRWQSIKASDELIGSDKNELNL